MNGTETDERKDEVTKGRQRAKNSSSGAGTAFEKILAGLEDAIAFAKGNRSRGRERPIEIKGRDVKTIRVRLGLSQGNFAAVFGVPVATIRHWEHGQRRPRGAARVLLNVIDVRPDIVAQVLTKGLLPPPLAMTLPQLRKSLGKKQREVALAAQMPQVSAFENRNNHETKVLRRYIEALGGKLELIAIFDDNQRVRLKDA